MVAAGVKGMMAWTSAKAMVIAVVVNVLVAVAAFVVVTVAAYVAVTVAAFVAGAVGRRRGRGRIRGTWSRNREQPRA